MPAFLKYLLLQSGFPLSAIYHTRNQLKKLKNEEERIPGTNIINSFQTVVIGGSSVDLSSIGVMFHKLFDEIRERKKQLLEGIDLETIIDVSNELLDKPNIIFPGFYFGDVKENQLKGYETILSELILNHHSLGKKLGTVTAEGKMVLDYKWCFNFLKKMESIRSLLGTLLHISTPGPYRRTGYAAICLRNTPEENSRNIKAIYGRLCIVSEYNKISSAVSSFIITCNHGY